MILRFCLTFTAMAFAVALAASSSLVLAGDDSYSGPPPASEGTYSEPDTTYQEPQGDSLPGDDATPAAPSGYAPDAPPPPPPDAPQ